MKFSFILVGFSLLFRPVFAQTKAPVGTSQALYKKAIGYFDKGKDELGFESLQKALELNPDDHDALYALGYYHFEAEEYEKALQDFRNVIQRFPNDTSSYQYRGQASIELERYDEAEDDFNKALLLDKTDINTYNYLGYLYFKKENYARARSYFDQSIAIQPNADAHYYRAKMLYNEKQTDTAFKELETLLKLEPKNYNAFRLKALIYLSINKEADAIKIYEQLQKQKALTENDLLSWGLIYYYQKKYTQALTYFSIIAEHEEADLYYFRALTEYKLKRHAEALKSINRAIVMLDESDEENAPYFYDRAIIKHALTQKASAAKDFLRATYLVPEIINRLDYNGDTLELLGNAPSLLKGAYTSQQLDSVRVLGLLDRAEAYAEKDMIQAAIDEADKALDIEPQYSEAYRLRGSYRASLERYSEALRDLDKALALPKGRNEEATYYLRGITYLDTEQFGKAVEDLTKAIAKNAADPDYYHFRAQAYAGLNNFKIAIEDINKSLEKQPEETEYLLTRAGIFNEMKQYDKATEDCNTVLKADDANAVAYYYRGLAHEGLKRYEQSSADLSKAFSLDPELVQAQDALQEVMLKLEK